MKMAELWEKAKGLGIKPGKMKKLDLVVDAINSETHLAEMTERMWQTGRRALSIVDQQNEVQGIVTVFDIFKGLLKQPSPD